MPDRAPDCPTLPDTLELAARGLGRIDRDGLRGMTLLSIAEIEAMAVALTVLGLVAIPPGAPAPERLLITPERTPK